MIAITILAVFAVGLCLGFLFGATVFAKIKTEEVARKAGVSAKQLKKQMELLRQSMNLIHGFLHPTSLDDDLDYLSKPSRERAEKLLNEYNEEVK